MRIHSLLVTGLLLTVGASAQEAPVFPSPAYFRQHFTTHVPSVELQPPTRLSDFVADDKLELSLRSYLELVLANNTDIAIQRYTIEPQRNAITRAFAIFDPTLDARFSSTRANNPSTDVLQGAETVSQLTQPATFSYNQLLGTGTSFRVGFDGSKRSTNSSFSTFNPSLSSSLSFGLTQPLLRGRGARVTKLPILVARTRLRSAEYSLQDQLLRLLSTAENAYWDVVQARESLRVQEQSLSLNDAALKRAERELELGALSPLDIYQPQAEYASAEIRVSQARYLLEQREDALRKQMGADLDQNLRSAPIVLTEPVLPPTEAASIDRNDAVMRAIAMRPDLKSIQESLVIDDLNLESANNSLRPDLNLSLNYSSAGRGGIFYDRTNVFDEAGTASTVISTIPGGFGDALDQMFGFNFPTYGFSLNLRLPIRDRAASAGLADAVVNKRLNTLRMRTLEQGIRVDVLNAISQVESSKASVRLATVARDLAQKTYEAEQKKYELGTNILYLVLQAQNSLNQAESRLVNESINYRKNMVNLLRMTGELLESRGVKVQ